MKQLRPLLFVLVLISTWLRAENEPIGWDIQGKDIEFHFKTGEAVGTNGVTVTKGDFFLSADKATANEKTGVITAEGHVLIKNKEQVWNGDKVTYNFKTHDLSAVDLETSHGPLFVSTMSLSGNSTTNRYEAKEGFITTDDISQPAYHIRAKRIVVVPGEYIEAHDAIAYVGNVPVFYYPYFHRKLGRHLNNWVFDPGYRSSYGAYLQTTYNWYASEKLDGAVHFDLRSKRGVGTGPDVHLHLGPRLGDAEVKYYYTHDEDPGTDLTNQPVPSNRERVRFSHQATIDTNFTAKAVIDYQSDPTIVRDFFESEYRRNVQPNSFMEVNKAWPNFSLDTLVQPRVNPFYDAVQRLPDVRLTGLRQQIFDTPLYYESESDIGYFERVFSNTNAFQPNFSATRADTFHQITLPQTYFGWLNVTPRAGGRFTYYSEASGPGATTLEQTRGVFNTGAEVSFKTWRIWNGAKSQLLEVDGIRHIFEPSINYVYVPTPNVAPTDLPQFDYQISTFRLLPIEFTDYNSIDSIYSANTFRFGIRNKLQTKRDGQTANLLNWALYTDWNLSPRQDFSVSPTNGPIQTNINQTTFSDVFSDLDFRPRSWITLNSFVRYGIDQGYFREADHRLTLLPNDVWSVTLGHRYLHSDPTLGQEPTGDNLIYDSVYYRFNENWGARMSHYFQARDGNLQEQIYTLYRDLRSWTAALTFRAFYNHGNNQPDDYTVGVTFSLKAFPKGKLGTDTDKPWALLGR